MQWFLTMDDDGECWDIHMRARDTKPKKRKQHGSDDIRYPRGNFQGEYITGFDDVVNKIVKPGQCIEIEPIVIKVKVP